MTRNEIREKIEGFGIYFDPDHPDHISRDKIDTLEPPFIEWGTQKRSLRADGIDYVLATKVFRKFDALNLSLIRGEIRGLIQKLDALFGKDTMKESIAYLRRLQKS